MSKSRRAILGGGAALALAGFAPKGWARGDATLVSPEWASRYARAERLLTPALERLLPGVPFQRRHAAGGRAILDPLVDPAWAPDGTFYYWGPDQALWRAEPLAKRKTRLLDRAALEGVLSRSGATGARAYPPRARLDGARPVLDIQIGDATWRVDVEAMEARRLPAPKPNGVEARSPDGAAAAFVRDHDLYVRGADEVERRITSDASVWYSFDPRFARSNPVHRSTAPARPPAVIWLPGEGRRFLIERWDFREVGSVWMIDSLSEPRPTLVEQRMAVPGEAALPKPEFWIVDADTGSARRVDAGGWDYLGNMDVRAGGYFPAPDGKTLLFNRMNRDYSRVELVELNLATGAQRVILREPEGSGPGVRSPRLTFIEGGRAVLWTSARSGRIQFWRVDLASGAVRQATRGDFTADEVLYVDEAGKRLYFMAYGDGVGGDPYYPHAWVADLRTGKAKRLDDADLAHSAVFSPDGRYFIDTGSRLDAAPRAWVRDTEGRVLLDLGEADISALKAIGWRAPERVKAKGADGISDIYGTMWKPTDFDPSRRYPVVVRVYPGPTFESHPLGFSPGGPAAALAELGFIVVHLGQRGGSPVRDRAYANYSKVQGSVRDYPLADNRSAVIDLGATRPWMDLDRVGMIGESGGAFMTVSALLAYPDFYKVGVAAAGNFDNRIYEANSSEFFWGLPGQPGSARYDTVQAEASRLSGALMLVHGDLDDDVAFSHSVRLASALNRAGKRYEFVLLLNAGHFDFDDQTSVYYRQRVWRFLIDNLRP